MPLPADTSPDTPHARRSRALAALSASGSTLWFATFVAGSALSAHVCALPARVTLAVMLAASLACSVLALRIGARQLRHSNGIADPSLRAFLLLAGVMLNAFSMILTLGLAAAVFTEVRCE